MHVCQLDGERQGACNSANFIGLYNTVNQALTIIVFNLDPAIITEFQ